MAFLEAAFLVKNKWNNSLYFECNECEEIFVLSLVGYECERCWVKCCCNRTCKEASGFHADKNLCADCQAGSGDSPDSP